MRVEGDSIPLDGEEGNAQEPGGGNPSATADKFARIIEDAQSSTREFLDTVRRQSQSILAEAEDEARKQRATILEDTQDRVETLVATSDEMLGEAERLRSSLEEISMSLRESASRLRTHVDELVGSDQLPAHDEDPGYDEDEADDDGAVVVGDTDYPPPNRRRFGLR